jgi:hypothetical protein
MHIADATLDRPDVRTKGAVWHGRVSLTRDYVAIFSV